jgi:hypothetical protein
MALFCANRFVAASAPFFLYETSMPISFHALAMIAGLLLLAGCGATAAPCRVASAGLEVVPVVGGVLAAPTDGCAAVID